MGTRQYRLNHKIRLLLFLIGDQEVSDSASDVAKLLDCEPSRAHDAIEGLKRDGLIMTADGKLVLSESGESYRRPFRALQGVAWALAFLASWLFIDAVVGFLDRRFVLPTIGEPTALMSGLLGGLVASIGFLLHTFPKTMASFQVFWREGPLEVDSVTGGDRIAARMSLGGQRCLIANIRSC